MLIALYPWLTSLITPLLLELPFAARGVVVMVMIAPLGLLMGVPFARGIAVLHDADCLVPWAWAANGSASVISAVLAVMLSLSFSFTVVLLFGSGLYLVAAGLAISRPTGESAAQTLHR